MGAAAPPTVRRGTAPALAPERPGWSPAAYVDEFVAELRLLIRPVDNLDDLRARYGTAKDLAERVAHLLPVLAPFGDAIGPVYTTAQVRELLGASRQAISDRVYRGRLLALRTANGRLVYPTFQFDGDGVRDGIATILQSVGPVEDPWALAAWMRAQQPALGTTIVEYLTAHHRPVDVLVVLQEAVTRWRLPRH